MIRHGARALPGTERVNEHIVFRPGMPGCRRQTGSWRGIGLHWTGGERGHEALARTLLARGLSVSFGIDPDGSIWQLADLDTRCAHIGSPGSSRLIGYEVSCRGFATAADLEAARLADPTLRERDELDWSTPRDTYRDTIARHRVHFAGFNAEQIDSIIWLSDYLATYMRFPRLIPARAVTPEEFALIAPTLPLANPGALPVKVGGQLWIPAFDRDVRKTATSRAAKHEGLLGHFQVHRNKLDPGTQPLYALWAAGWNPAGVKVPCIVTTDAFCSAA